MSDETLTQTFEEIVADITPEAHWLCELCYPEDQEGDLKAVCGVVLLGLPALPDSPECEECKELWPTHGEVEHGLHG